jgi:phosphoribosylamine--glycine ligase
MDCDFGQVLLAAAEGRLSGARFAWKPDPSVAIVLAAHGYPGKVRTGDPIHGIDQAEAAGATVFQAGTKIENGALVTAAGRVLAVTASGPTLESSIGHAYDAVKHIHFEGAYFRHDIGRKGLRRWRT